ncbi:homeobox protein 5 [Culex quinquefasciatus]|uniref:homeobox protein 5 n=1 Tax=Culex quinquefasciatus TaxID=7176 RepID=UPI0018E3EC38|nr:homeobox protein 5 [Culex quinquefasciatus]
MREVDSSETSVVWPAWCYSGETTVNEDLPQATSAPPTERHQQLQQLQHRFQQSSSNQSQSSSASSSPSSAHSAQGGSHKSRGRRGSFSTKRKSITPSSVSPGNSALTAALGASSVAALAATAAAAAAAFQASPRRSTPPTGSSLQLQLPENGTNGRGGSPTNSTTPNEDGHYSPVNHNNNNNSSASTNFNSQVAALQSLDKMLSERIYDRKKYLNSPTGSSAAVAAFYEKFRNVAAASAGEVELNLIKSSNGQQSPSGLVSDLSAIGANHHGGSGSASPSCGPNGSNSGSVGNLLVANGHSSGGGGVSEGNSHSLSNSNNQNSNGNNNGNSGINNSSSSSIGSTNNSNNNSIKSERFSPTNNDVQSTASRSRSVTPSSFSGTPPQTMHPADVAAFSSSISAVATSGLLPSPGNGSSGGGGGAAGRPEFQARNYSDFMRSLAAKYNNNNISTGNDQSSVKNPFLEPKMRINQPKSFIENSLVVGSKKGSPITSTQVPNPSIMSSLFPGLPFQSAVFPPLIDMSSTQALVALARAAKESGIANLLKPEDGGLKKPSAGSRSSSPPSGSAPHHFPSPFSASRYLPAGLLPNHLAAAVNYPPQSGTTAGTTSVPAISPLKSPSRTPSDGQLHLSSGTFPLDLSSAPGGAKRIKLSSPTPSRNQDTSPAPSSTNSQPSDGELGGGGKLARKCHARIEEISAWTVDNVCDFVSSIDICAEYVQNFRDQSIDGAGLPLLTEEHLTNSLGMKLGPALKLKSMLAKRLGGPCPCALCATPPTPSSRMSNKGDTTPTNRPPSNGSVG